MARSFAQATSRMHLVAGARGAEAAVGAGDHALAPDHTGEALDALRHQFRMLDQVDAMRHHAGHQDLVVGQLHLLPDLPFVLVARVRALDKYAHALIFSIRSAKCLSSKSCTRGAMLTL